MPRIPRFVVVFLLGATAVLVAQRFLVGHSARFEAQYASLSKANPPGVRFDLRTASGQTRFRVGEPIPIELRFSSSVAGTYGLDAALYDRSGRLQTDWFE